MTNTDQIENTKDVRFQFGQNWTRFLSLLDKQRIEAAEISLINMLNVESLKGQCFLDIGSGSGLFSLAAHNLGAKVHSFDYDVQSVACTAELRRRYSPDSQNWVIEHGDALDNNYLANFGKLDVVYSWGVLHHTGRMWEALNNVAPLVALDGKLFIAIYNDQRWLSKYWTYVKKFYNTGFIGRWFMVLAHAPYFLTRNLVRLMVTRKKQIDRGMDVWRDIIDWLGGYPFEVAKPEEIFEFFKNRGFSLEKMITVGGRHGCNQFVFRKVEDAEIS